MHNNKNVESVYEKDPSNPAVVTFVVNAGWLLLKICSYCSLFFSLSFFKNVFPFVNSKYFTLYIFRFIVFGQSQTFVNPHETE